jgi:hypothetical protein
MAVLEEVGDCLNTKDLIRDTTGPEGEVPCGALPGVFSMQYLHLMSHSIFFRQLSL